MNPITYLDNAAAMPVEKDILSLFAHYSEKYYANPEAVHGAGREAKLAIEDSASTILNTLIGEGEYSLFFTASATEAINLALGFSGFKRKVIVTTDAEHSAMKSVIELGGFCENRKVSIGNDGMVDPVDLESKLDSDVAVVSIHHVQNESGVEQDLTEIRKIMDQKAPKAVFIVDTVQSVGKIPVKWKEAQINIGFIGGHKVGAPTGGALIYNLPSDISNDFAKYLNKVRSIDHSIGRPDTSVCLSLADALKKAESLGILEKMTELNRYLRAELMEFESAESIDLQLPVPANSASPYITMLLMPQYQAEVVVRMLSDKGVMVSAGSACEASRDKPSQTLIAMGISSANARTAIRISFSFDSGKDDVDCFMEALREVLVTY